MIIIEGPDRAGKTTLCKYLQGRGYAYHHEGPPATEHLLQHYGLRIFEAQRQTVFDRLALGEHVYGPVMRGRDLLQGYQGLKLMNRLFVGWGCLVVICLPDYEPLLEQWRQNRKNEYVDSETKLAQIYDRYQELAFELTQAKATRRNYAIFDYRVNQPVEVLLAHAVLKPSYRHLIGNPNPMFLFVGELANHSKLDLAFFSLRGSSRYLNDCLADAGYQEHEMAFINALTLDGQKLQENKLRTMTGKPRVIALGNVAATALQGNSFKPHVTVPHPAYWKRFKSRERDSYVRELKDVRDDAYRGYGYHLTLESSDHGPRQIRDRYPSQGQAN